MNYREQERNDVGYIDVVWEKEAGVIRGSAIAFEYLEGIYGYFSYACSYCKNIGWRRAICF